MNKTFKKITSTVMAVMTLAVSATGMAANASTGIGMEDPSRATKSYWNLHRFAGAPSSTDVFSASGNVTGLVNGSDTGLTFVRTGFSDSGNGNIKGKCDIQLNVKKNQYEYAYISANSSSSTCLFKDGWYSICYGTVSYSTTIINYEGYPFNIDGYAW